MSSCANDQAKALQFCWGYVALFPRRPHILIAKLFQPPYNDVFPTVKELSEMQNKDMNLRFPLIHPQLQVSCALAKMCLVHRWPCPPASKTIAKLLLGL